MQEEGSVGFFAALIDGVVWVLQNILSAFINFGSAVSQPSLWLDWSNQQAVMRFVYYGGSVEFFFVIFTFFLSITIIGIISNRFLWRAVRTLEGFANTVGRFFAWAWEGCQN